MAIGEIDSEDPSAPLKKWTKNISDLPKGHWRADVKRRLRKWSAKIDEKRAAERPAKQQRSHKQKKRRHALGAGDSWMRIVCRMEDALDGEQGDTLLLGDSEKFWETSEHSSVQEPPFIAHFF